MAIDPHHPLIQETLSKVLKSGNMSLHNIKISDYDSMLYMIVGLSETHLAFTLLSDQVKSIGDAGGYNALDEHFQGLQTDKSTPDQYSVIIDTSQLPSNPDQRTLTIDQIVQKFSCFRTVFLSGPYFQALSLVKQGRSFAPLQVDIRKSERLWIIPGETRVSFVFQIIYKDTNDTSLAKIFLQEFQDAKKQISNAPVISFGSSPPENISAYRPKTEGLFLSVTILKDQITNPLEQSKWISGFKQYLSYHIHSCKTYLHMRMRKRSDLLYNALKQAVPEKLEEKTFKRVRATKGIKEEAKIINNFKN